MVICNLDADNQPSPQTLLSVPGVQFTRQKESLLREYEDLKLQLQLRQLQSLLGTSPDGRDLKSYDQTQTHS